MKNHLPRDSRGIAVLALALAAVSGCKSVPVNTDLQRQSAPFLDCPSEKIDVANYDEGVPGVRPSTWDASGCGRRVSCQWNVAQGVGAGSNAMTRPECTRPGS